MTDTGKQCVSTREAFRATSVHFGALLSPAAEVIESLVAGDQTAEAERYGEHQAACFHHLVVIHQHLATAAKSTMTWYEVANIELVRERLAAAAILLTAAAADPPRE